MNPLMRLTGFTQGSVASGPTSFPNFLRTQAKLVQAVADDLTPAAINWLDLGIVEATPSNNSAQVTGINDVIALRLTWTPGRSSFLVKTSAAALGFNDIVANPSGWVSISNGGVVFAANGSHIGFGSADVDTIATISNADAGNQTIDTFACLSLGGD